MTSYKSKGSKTTIDKMAQNANIQANYASFGVKHGTSGPGSLGSKPGGKKLVAKQGNSKIIDGSNKRKSSNTPNTAQPSHLLR